MVKQKKKKKNTAYTILSFSPIVLKTFSTQGHSNGSFKVLQIM